MVSVDLCYVEKDMCIRIKHKLHIHEFEIFLHPNNPIQIEPCNDKFISSVAYPHNFLSCKCRFFTKICKVSISLHTKIELHLFRAKCRFPNEIAIQNIFIQTTRSEIEQWTFYCFVR